MNWSTPAELRAQVQRLWERGLLLASVAGGEPVFPRRLAFKAPSSSELSERFEQVRAWISELRGNPHYRLQMREVRHRVLGSNSIPAELWIDTLEDAVALLGKRAELQRFVELLALTNAQQPTLVPWIAKRPLQILELAEDWPLLLGVVSWVQAHPRPNLYLRQIDLPGIHSKFVETRRGVLAELLDLAMPAEYVAEDRDFFRRHGFRDRAWRVRFRMLDPQLSLLPGDTDQDLKLNHQAFAQLAPKARTVVITENEINFLTLPNLPLSMAIFGAGYGFDMLKAATWLQQCRVYYWGDIDTHGFAILEQLRGVLPHAQSLLMDRQTLELHRAQWVLESKPERRDLPRLTPVERELYDDLRDNRLGPGVRLEQERIAFGWVSDALAALAS